MLNVNIYAKKRMKLIFVFVFLLISACCFSEGLAKAQDGNVNRGFIDKIYNGCHVFIFLTRINAYC